jgi:hypothetical protein
MMTLRERALYHQVHPLKLCPIATRSTLGAFLPPPTAARATACYPLHARVLWFSRGTHEQTDRCLAQRALSEIRDADARDRSRAVDISSKSRRGHLSLRHLRSRREAHHPARRLLCICATTKRAPAARVEMKDTRATPRGSRPKRRPGRVKLVKDRSDKPVDKSGWTVEPSKASEATAQRQHRLLLQMLRGQRS